MISDASAARARRVDFLRGEEEYKFELTGLAAENWNITLSPRRSGRSFPFRGLLAGIDLAGRAWNRERLILSVHLLQHGLAAGITRYLRFRAERGMRKIRPAGAARRAKAGTGAST
jgi:hypothetical protein